MSMMSALGPGVSVTTLSTVATDAAERAAAKLAADGVPGALAAKDTRLWGPQAAGDASRRLGWLDAPRASRPLLDDLAELAARARENGLDHVVLAGMGGSSLAPEVIARTARVPLTVLDTTDPRQVGRAVADRLDRTLVVVSSKSGSTVETDCLRRIYQRAFAGLGLPPEEIARRFVVVTDPGSPLQAAARQAGYPVVLADPTVGGRYSALTASGLAPSALAGAEVAGLLDDAAAALPALAADENNPGLLLGSVLGGFAQAGHDKVVLAPVPGYAAVGLGDWAEQLIAESTGKQGRGILPVVVSGADSPGFSPGPDVHLLGFCESEPRSPLDTVISGSLGAQFLVWEYAIAVAGRLLGTNPFDQPDVQDSTDNTRELLDRSSGGPLGGDDPAFADGAVDVHADSSMLRGASGLAGALDAAIWSVPPGGYLAVMAYLDRGEDADAARLRSALAARTTRPVTFGWGPRSLHSTGQYHQGGPQNGVFLQITGEIGEDVEVPDAGYTLGRLQLAQALGDLEALRRRGRPVIRLHLRDRAAGVQQLISAGGGA